MTETPQNNANSEESEARRKFREELERKSNASRAKKAHEEGRLKVKAMNGPAGQTRHFRRKTG
ncbi:DUF5302 domain-containing protein [Streptomyces sp. NPDC102264]|uniref:DUF5302 domain-containing protein n=1 Tax=Streptomyces sp. NPDC102264 TaxID=3366149 RepID=UPI0038037F9C